MASNKYPDWLLHSAGPAQPGTAVSVRDGIQAAVKISAASVQQTRVYAGYGEKRGGPFGCIDLRVSRKKICEILQPLRGKAGAETLEEILKITGSVVGLGYNSVDLDCDSSAHAEIKAARSTASNIGIPLGSLPQADIGIIRLVSGEPCTMCRGNSQLWLPCHLVGWAATAGDIRRTACFAERTDGSDAGEEAEPPLVAWETRTNGDPLAFFRVPEFREEAKKALQSYCGLMGDYSYQPK